MKTLADLQAIRERKQQDLQMRKEREGTRVVVGMATCGIAAGARPVFQTLVSEVNRRGLTDVVVQQTGCIGMCRFEPIVEVYFADQPKVTYINMTEDKAIRVVAEHLVNGKVIDEYTIGDQKA